MFFVIHCFKQISFTYCRYVNSYAKVEEFKFERRHFERFSILYLTRKFHLSLSRFNRFFGGIPLIFLKQDGGVER